MAQVIYKGKAYKSLHLLCEEKGLNVHTILSRVHRYNMTLEKAIDKGAKNREEGGKVKDHTGQEFPSFAAMCREWGIFEPQIVRRKLQRGASLEKALTDGPNSRAIKDHLGNEFSTTKEMAKAWGVSYQKLLHRLHAGWSVKDALTKIKKYSGNFSEVVLEYKGEKFKSIAQIAKRFNLPYCMLKNRILRIGLTVEQAVGFGNSRLGNNSMDHLGNQFANFNAMAKAYNIKPFTLNKRLDQGMSLKKALTAPVCSGKRNKDK